MHLNTFLKRILEPVILGSVSNIIINYIFNPGSFEFILEEFIIAIILYVPLIAANRYIDRRLDKKISWTEHPLKRFATHLAVIFLLLVLLLNTLGSAYMWITQKGFFSLNELIVINLVTLCLAVLLTFIKWAIHFYRRWVHAENYVSASEKIIEELKRKIIQPTELIELLKGNSKITLQAQAIRLAKIKFGTVRIYSDSGLCGIYPGSLSQLNTLLPEHLFFQVTRDAILHKSIIRGITPSTFGKIMIQLDEKDSEGDGLTVSRPKAAAFRKWYNSISA